MMTSEDEAKTSYLFNTNVQEYQKYNTNISNSLVIWSYIQLIISIGFIFHFSR